MIAWRSIEFRLTAWYSLMLFVGYVVFSAVLWWTVRYAVRGGVDGLLEERLERLAQVVVAEALADAAEYGQAEDEDDDEAEEGEETDDDGDEADDTDEDDEEDADGDDDEEDDDDAEEGDDEDEVENQDGISFEIEEDLVEYILASPESHLAQVRDGFGRQVLPTDGSESAPVRWDEIGAAPVFLTLEVGDAPYRMLHQEVTLMGRRYKIVLASSLESLEIVRDRLAASFLVASPLALALCSFGGFYVARAALRPVDQLTDAAADITVGNLSQRIAVPETGDALERLSRTFNEMLERLETSVTKIEQFSVDASHELRTPLSVIRTTAELALRHGAAEDDHRSDLQDIKSEAEHLTDLIDVLLTLSRTGGQSESIPMQQLNLGELATSTCRQFEREAAAKGLKLELHVPKHSVSVRGNEAALRRMISSLVENALAHTHEGEIRIVLGNGSDRIRLSVKDTGEGIPREALGRVFDRFYRADASRSRASRRLGLGLSIAKRIAELHDAELTVESKVEEGSEFTIHFDGTTRETEKRSS